MQKIQDEVNATSSLGIDAVYLDKIPLPIQVKAAVQLFEQIRQVSL